MTTRFIDHLLEGDHASRPAASAVPQGTLYACTTHPLIYQSDGASWSTWASLGGTETLPATIIDAKGDLIAGSAADTAARLAAGSNDSVLMADSGQATGLKWVAPATPSTVGTANAEGTADTFTRGDHVHAHEAAHIAHDTAWAAKGDLIAATANDTAAILGVGANDTILMADSGQATGLKWAAPGTPVDQDYDDVAAEGTADTWARSDHLHGMPSASGGGGGGAAHSYVGYNTVGGSTEAIVSRRQYMKQITLAADGLISSIGAYVKQTTANEVLGMTVGVLSDSGGAPNLVLASAFADTTSNSGFFGTNTGSAGAARWLHVPLGLWLTAGTYWLAVEFEASSSSHNIYYDGSGSDRYYTNAALRITDSGWTSVTTSSNKYSIRADFFEIATVGAVLDDPVLDIFGTPDSAYEFDTNSLSGWTNLGSATAQDAHTTIPDHYYVNKAATGSTALTGIYRACGSFPQTYIAKLTDHTLAAVDYERVGGLFIADSTPNVIEAVYFVHNGDWFMSHDRYSNPTTYNSTIGTDIVQKGLHLPVYYGIVVNSSSNVDFYTSRGGRVWRKRTSARNPSITVANFGILVDPENNTHGVAAAFDFVRVWNSAKTFPGV